MVYTLFVVEQNQWFVMNAYHAELKVERLLQREQIRCFIPKHYIIKKNRYGKTQQLVPVIPGLVFVYSTFHVLNDIQRPLTFLSFATTPRLEGGHSTMKVPDAEMENFIRISSHSEEQLRYYRPEEVDLKKGQRIRIIGGVFDGAEGVLLKVKGIRDKRLVVSLPNLLTVSATRIEPEFIQIL